MGDQSESVWLHEIAKMLLPPANPDPIAGSEISTSLGRREVLPLDYIAFMRIYGPGYLFTSGTRIEIDDLTSDCEGVATRFLEIHRDLRGSFPESRIDGRVVRISFFPEPDGLLPWGCDDMYFAFFFETKTWKIVVHNRVEFLTVAASFTEFLARSMNCTLKDGRYLHQGFGHRRFMYCRKSDWETGVVTMGDWMRFAGIPMDSDSEA